MNLAAAKQQAVTHPVVQAVPRLELQRKQVITVLQLLVELVELKHLHQQNQRQSATPFRFLPVRLIQIRNLPQILRFCHKQSKLTQQLLGRILDFRVF